MALVGLCVGAWPAAARATAPPLDPIVTPVVPAGCPASPIVRAVIVGRVEATDFRTARFVVLQVRSGSVDGLLRGGFLDVDYFDDVRYLNVGERYVVGVGYDERTRRAVSKVRSPEPRFGGSQIVALDDLDCPPFVDDVRTLTLDGTPVESGVLAPLLGQGPAIVRAILLPVLWVFGGLVVLAGIKAFITAVARAGAARS
jgi:hypothetical protein